MKNRIQIYTHGACSNNHSKNNTGGYGVIILKPEGQTIKLNGGYQNTTNNRMELKAVIEALKVIKMNHSIIVYSGSQYVIKGITEWIHNWIKKNKIIKNKELWMELYDLTISFHDIQFLHIKGYNGNKYNEIADRLATNACGYYNLPIDIRE